MRKRFTVAFVLLAGAGATLFVAAFAAAGSGQNKVKADTLNGWQEGPAISSTGTGSFEAVIDDEAQTITYTLSYQDLEGGTPTQAHIHIGKRAENGGVSAFLCAGSKPPCPPSGTVTGVIVPADVVGPAAQGVEPGSFAELVRALRTGNAYVNVHNQRWPGGEIRAQVNDFNQRETG